MNKKVLIPTLVVGLAIGGVLGFQAISNTPASHADTDASSIAQEVRGERAAVTKADVDRTSASVKSFMKDSGKQLKFIKSGWNPYYTKAEGQREGQVTNLADSEGWLYTVALDTNKIVQVGPRERESLDEPTPEIDFTKRYTKDQLQDYAVNWLKDHGVNVDEVTKGLQFKVTSKDDRGYFFRWYDPSANNSDGNMRFLQVGFSIGGSLLSYTNTL